MALKKLMIIRERKGFSFIEVVTVAAVMVIISVVVVTNLFSRKSRTDLDLTTRKIVATMREAQSRSAAQESSVIWGVRLGNTTNTAAFYALFQTSYAATTTVGYWRLPVGVQYSTSSIAQGNYLDITFAQISGVPSTSTSVTLNLVPGKGVTATSTITVNTNGLIVF